MDHPTQRPDLDTYFLRLAEVIATRSTCPRRQVGCVLVNARGQVLSTGYNGVPAGLPHCLEPRSTCVGHTHPSGTALGACQAVHAEENALLQCRDVYAIHTCYVTTEPCADRCVKLLMNTSCRRVVAARCYAAQGDAARALWHQRHGETDFLGQPTWAYLPIC